MDAGIGEALIQAEVDLRLCNDTFCIQYAITNRSLQRRKTKWVNFVFMLLETGASPNKFKEISNLVEVTVQGNARLVEEILKHGGDVNYADKCGTKRTALHYACILSKILKRRKKILRTYSDRIFIFFFIEFFIGVIYFNFQIIISVGYG